MSDRMKRALLVLTAIWFVPSIILVVWMIRTVRDQGQRVQHDFALPSPAIEGASQAIDEEHARMIYRYFPQKLSQNWEEMLIRDYFQDMRGGIFCAFPEFCR